MRPSQADLIGSASWTIDEYLAPEVTSDIAKSAVLTVQYLLHQTQARVEQEAQALFEHVDDLRSTLGRVVVALDDGSDDERDPLTVEVTRVLEESRRPEGDYPTLASLEAETTELRRILDVVIWALDSRRPDGGSTVVDDGIRTDIRACLRRQLEREERWSMTGYSKARR